MGTRKKQDSDKIDRLGNEARRVEKAGKSLPRRDRGDPGSLIAIDSPDDVDLYRHDGPPPGFRKASLRPPDEGKDNHTEK